MIDAKKDGRDIPKTETNRINLSTKVSLYSAEKTPRIKPNNKAIRGISWKIIIFFTSKKNDEYPNRDYFKTLKRRIK